MTGVAVVTGGASGIGRATVERLTQDGYHVCVLDLDGKRAREVAGADGLGLTVDITDPDSVQTAVDEIIAHFARVDVIVNNAGISGSEDATVCHETSLDEWDRVFAVNIRGVFLLTRALLPVLMAQRSGHVITIVSVAGFLAYRGRCAYNASKGAALQFARSLAVDYADQGIRSNAVCPGFVETPMTRWRLDIPALQAEVVARIPLGHVAQPEDIANAVSVLASDRMAYANGSALVVDGGWSAAL